MGNDPSFRAAAIDLGSNSFRLLIVGKNGAGLRPLCNRLITVALGQGLMPGCNLSSHSMDRALTALRTFRQDLDRHAPQRLRACGTEALRRAANSMDFLAEAERILGRRIEILTGEEEARLTYEAVVSDLDLPVPFLIADVGGGSTELITVRDRPPTLDCRSFPFGALSLTDRFAGVENGDEEMQRCMRRHVRESLAHQDMACGISLVGSGGTITALAALLQGLACYDRTRIHGCRIALTQLNQTFDQLSRMPVAERCKLFGLEDGRGRIIIAGLAIFQVIAELCRAETLLVSDAGLLEGILLSALRSNGTLAG